MKAKRVFLESLKDSDSYIRVSIDEHDGNSLGLKLSDCDRRIWWHFGRPGDKRAIRKIKVVKALIDEVHDYLIKADKA
jgi:hypothetical protein